MNIEKRLSFFLYAIFILLSIIIGMIYIYKNIKKETNNKQIIYFFLMYLSFAIICGKMYTVLAYGKDNILTAGLSSYGGLFGVVLAAIVFEKIVPTSNSIIKYTILSLPLVYGISKIGCSIVGCCGGIPYTGILKIKYIYGLNIWQFPIQIIESVISLIIFFICEKNKDNKNINYIVLILVSITKFILDFFRYDHINILITKNQIFSMIIFLVTISLYLLKKIKKIEII